ncbi:nuclear factor interleukin-3-regulated protein-like [Microplitis mediator]|uniref:nuclear factor interleukin-3-regulated protein-like n=1 Tax=Microplitis mediator TaxID=375433 RepID=UPI0025522E8C|nr:nuclear factor interleukin-3-regulated protein-like [Microplitis mediator]XP_057340811.1 nuclear factor interleukin-3-regulated protein-like [Microplitis mediator]
MNSLSGGKKYRRSEKKPMADDKKDDKYYERRKRNNEAAKKSRDARKLREDFMAIRAKLLENENGILWKKIILLCQEVEALHEFIRKTRQFVPANRTDRKYWADINHQREILIHRPINCLTNIAERPSTSTSISSSSSSSVDNNNNASVTALTFISRLSSISHAPTQFAI